MPRKPRPYRDFRGRYAKRLGPPRRREPEYGPGGVPIVPLYNRRVPKATQRQRYAILKQWVTPDVADYLARRMNLSSKDGQRLLTKLRRRVREYEKQHPGIRHAAAVDEVTRDIIDAIRRGEEEDEDLQGIGSP